MLCNEKSLIFNLNPVTKECEAIAKSLERVVDWFAALAVFAIAPRWIVVPHNGALTIPGKVAMTAESIPMTCARFRFESA
jgi:hypothetical protein